MNIEYNDFRKVIIKKLIYYSKNKKHKLSEYTAEDMFQEGYEKFTNSSGKYSCNTGIKKYIFTICKNVYLQQFASKYRSHSIYLDKKQNIVSIDDITENLESEDFPNLERFNNYLSVDFDNRFEQINLILKSLSTRKKSSYTKGKRIFYYHIIGYSNKEISIYEGMTEFSISTTINRIKKRLRRKIKL